MFYFNYWIKKYTISTDFFDAKNKYSLRTDCIHNRKCGERILVKLFQGSGIIMEEVDAERFKSQRQ